MIGRPGHGMDRSAVICLTVVAAILLLTGMVLAVGTNPAGVTASHHRPAAASGPDGREVARPVHP